jgi:hypothetical protein
MLARSTIWPLVALSLGLLGLGALACGSSDTDIAPADAGSSTDGPSTDTPDGTTGDAGVDGAKGCVRVPAAADRARKVVISHPFLEAGSKAKDFEVLDLSPDGVLTRPTVPVTFTMGTALEAPVIFTPDGAVGLVAQDDGSIGVFRLPAVGPPVVVHAAFDGGFYAGPIVLAPDGATAWVLDSNVGKNGGGVYQIAIACDGTLTSLGLVVPGGGASAMALLPGDPSKAVLAAKQAFQSPAGMDVHLVDLANHMTLASVKAFGDLESIVSSIAIMPDGKHALVADDGINIGSRMAVVRLTPSFTGLSLLETPNPATVVASPFGDTAIVLNGDSTDQIHLLSYDGSKDPPFVITGELAYNFAKPQIPTTASMITQGKLRGTVLVGENLAVRQLAFDKSGKVTDVAKLPFPEGIANIVGVVGVQP